MAKVLREQVREIDLPARYGGEEFIVVLPSADLAACTAIAERIRRSIAECQMTRRSTGEALPGITVSIGVAQFQGGESMADLIDRCDRALYLAKKMGRNRVVTETELERREGRGLEPADRPCQTADRARRSRQLPGLDHIRTNPCSTTVLRPRCLAA